MKVIIISLPRTGSTTLLYSLGRLLNLKTYNEPFEKKYQGESYDFRQSHIVKTMINDFINNRGILELSNFDKVIILARKDLKAQLESFTFALKNDKWHENYNVNDIEIAKEHYYNFNAMRLNIEKLSKEINIPITWYEDLYLKTDKVKEEILKTWGIELDKEKFIDDINISGKYRKFETTL